MKKICLISLALAAVVFLGAGCSPSVSTNNTPAGTSAKTDISIQNFSFSPGAITVNKGMTVVWTNNDSAGHTVTADGANGPASSVLSPGATYAFTFNTAGTFNYHCSIHPSMKGTVIVN